MDKVPEKDWNNTPKSVQDYVLALQDFLLQLMVSLAKIFKAFEDKDGKIK